MTWNMSVLTCLFFCNVVLRQQFCTRAGDLYNKIDQLPRCSTRIQTTANCSNTNHWYKSIITVVIIVINLYNKTNQLPTYCTRVYILQQTCSYIGHRLRSTARVHTKAKLFGNTDQLRRCSTRVHTTETLRNCLDLLQELLLQQSCSVFCVWGVGRCVVEDGLHIWLLTKVCYIRGQWAPRPSTAKVRQIT